MQYIPSFLDDNEAQQLQRWLTSNAVHWLRESFPIFGKQVTAPRRLAWFGDDGVNYRYTGIDHCAQGWPESLQPLRAKVCAMAKRPAEQPFNFLLANRYSHGEEYMGWHRDDEHAADPLIASLSLGATRRFRVRSGPGRPSTVFDLANGSLLLLDGRQQHTLTKTKRLVGERINLTFRRIDAA